MVSACRAEQRVGCTGFGKARRAQPAAVAVAARPTRGGRVVATVRQAVIEPHGETKADDVGLGEVNERGVDRQRTSFDARLGGQPRQLLEGANELGTFFSAS